MTELETLVKEPEVWRVRAQGQVYVADVLRAAFEDLSRRTYAGDRVPETVGLVGAIAYHYGMALELAAKGAIAENTGAAPPLDKHKLAALCEEARLELSSAERELAARLTAAIEWWGRYAVPKKATHFADAKKERIPRLVLPEDLHTLMAILNRLGVSVLAEKRGREGP